MPTPSTERFWVWACCRCWDYPLGASLQFCFNPSCPSFQRAEPHERCSNCRVEHHRISISHLLYQPRPPESPQEFVRSVPWTSPRHLRPLDAPTVDHDAASIRTEDLSIEEKTDIDESFIESIAQTLIKSIDNENSKNLSDWRHCEELLEEFPRLLRNFALEVAYRDGFSGAKPLGLFVRKNRRKITAVFKRNLEMSRESDRSTAEENIHDTKGKVKLYDRSGLMGKSQSTPVEEERMGSGGLGRNEYDQPRTPEDTDDSPALMRPDSEIFRLMVHSSAFRRLCARVNSRIKLDYQFAERLHYICREAFSLFDHSTGNHALAPKTATILVDWYSEEFIQEQGYEDGRQSLYKAVTITGSPDQCQLLACIDYVRQVWPGTGEIVLDGIVDACKQSKTEQPQPTAKMLPDGAEILIAIGLRALKVECIGLPGTILEVLEILAWTGTALRQASIAEGVQYFEPYLEYMGSASQIRRSHWFRLTFAAESSTPGATSPDKSWSCWHGMFRNPVIAKGFPILYRPASKSIPGLELSLEGMATLIGAPKLTVIQQRAILKGFNAAIVPVEDAGDHIKWHLYVNEDGTRLSYSDARLHADSELPPVQLSWDELKTRRHVLGWTPKVSHNIGSPSANYSIGWSSPDFVGAGCALEKVAISGSTGFLSLGAEFSLGRKDKSPSIKRGMDAYFDTLNSLLSSYVVFYDVSDQRAWLTNAMHALLHLVRASLKHDSESELASEYMLKSLSELEEHVDPTSPKAAIRFLSNRSNLEKLLFPNPDDLRTEETKTTRAGPSAASPAEVSTAEIRTSTGVRLKDRIQQIIYVLEQTIDHQANVHSFAAPGVPLKLTPRETLEGYRFMDIAARTARSLTPRMVKLTTYNGAGKSWVDFTRAIRAVTLFGEGFGELLSPLQDSVAQTTENNVCPNWQCLPVGKDYLAVSTYDLARILKQEGSTAEYPLMKLAPGIFWQKPDTVFEKCACREDKHRRSCDRVQALLSPSFITKKKQQQAAPDPVLVDGGAVVFGRSERFPLKWPNRGEPKKDKASTDPPPPDGLTSTAPVPGLMDSMTSLSLSNMAASPSSSASSTGITNTATPPSSSSISTPLTDDAASISTTTTSPRTRKRQRLWNIAKSLTGA